VLAPLLAALSFGLHPLRVEVVAWASCQPYALAGACGAGALCAHARALAPPPADADAAVAPRATAAAAARWRVCAVVLYAAACAAKSAAAPLAAAHLALEAAAGGGAACSSAASPAALRMLICVAAVAAAALCGALYGESSHVEVTPPRHNEGAGLTPPQRVAAAAAALAGACRRGAHPHPLSAKYPLPAHISPLDAAHFPPLAALALAAAAGLRALARRLPAWRAALRSACADNAGDASSSSLPPRPHALCSFFALALLAAAPTSGLVKHGYDSGGADRYAFFPALLLTPAAAAALRALLTPHPPACSAQGGSSAVTWARVRAACVGGACVAALAACCARSAAQTGVWRDPLSFARAELASARTLPSAVAAANDLALALHAAGAHAEALRLLQRADVALGGAAPGHASMALTASAAAAALGRYTDGLDALTPPLAAAMAAAAAASARGLPGGVGSERLSELHYNAGLLASRACRLRDAAAHLAAAAAAAPDARTRAAAATAAARHAAEAPARCGSDADADADADAHADAAAAFSASLEALRALPSPVLISWPVEGVSGWGTLSRSLLRCLLRAGRTPLLLHALQRGGGGLDMRAALTRAERSALRAGHDALVMHLRHAAAAAAVTTQQQASAVAGGVAAADVACVEVAVPLPALHGLGNALAGSDTMPLASLLAAAAADASADAGAGGGSGGCVRLRGWPNVAIVFAEDTSSGLAPPAALAPRAAHFHALVAGSTWTQRLLTSALATLPPSSPVPIVALAIQGVSEAAFPVRSSEENVENDDDDDDDDEAAPFVVFSGGKLEYRKAQDVVIAAFRRFRGAHPGAARIVLAAAWHTEYPEFILGLDAARHVSAPPRSVTAAPDGAAFAAGVAAWLAENGVPRAAQRVLAGPLSESAVAAAMAAAHVTLFPSRAESGTNLFAAQALAMGVPTALTDAAGHADLVAAFSAAPPLLCIPLRRSTPLNATSATTTARRFRGVDGWVEPDVAEAAEALEAAWHAHHARRRLRRSGNGDGDGTDALAAAARAARGAFTWDAWYANLTAAVEAAAAVS
jgi:glycosyltransferase involved in cell wall biosynthesis